MISKLKSHYFRRKLDKSFFHLFEVQKERIANLEEQIKLQDQLIDMYEVKLKELDVKLQ